jgi:mono/diheme cytochrome c family protein
MRELLSSSPWARPPKSALLVTAAVGLVTIVAGFADLPNGAVTIEQALRGRELVIQNDCGACHNRGNPAARHNPDHPRWLSGLAPGADGFHIGPLQTRPRNLTPDNETGLGRISERQIFNALRYGLKPGDTPDVVITSSVPGQGNFPATPKYLAPPMPWGSFRHKPDEELWAIAAYLKHGIKAVSNKVPDSEGPPDFWASQVTVDKLGPYPLPPYPMGNEEFQPDGSVTLEQVLRGRQLVNDHLCGECHNRGNPAGSAYGKFDPGDPHWLSGLFPGAAGFQIGKFKTNPRNLTPDNLTGLGRISERQIFNALRYGLKPGDTPDVVITANVPGQGNFPATPKYLAPPMPWPSWRHMKDEDLMAIAAYLKHGIKAVSNKVPDSEGPPDFWAGEYAPGNYGPYPLLAFPMGNEEFKQ